MGVPHPNNNSKIYAKKTVANTNNDLEDKKNASTGKGFVGSLLAVQPMTPHLPDAAPTVTPSNGMSHLGLRPIAIVANDINSPVPSQPCLLNCRYANCKIDWKSERQSKPPPSQPRFSKAFPPPHLTKHWTHISRKFHRTKYHGEHVILWQNHIATDLGMHPVVTNSFVARTNARWEICSYVHFFYIGPFFYVVASYTVHLTPSPQWGPLTTIAASYHCLPYFPLCLSHKQQQMVLANCCMHRLPWSICACGVSFY